LPERANKITGRDFGTNTNVRETAKGAAESGKGSLCYRHPSCDNHRAKTLSKGQREGTKRLRVKELTGESDFSQLKGSMWQKTANIRRLKQSKHLGIPRDRGLMGKKGFGGEEAVSWLEK